MRYTTIQIESSAAPPDPTQPKQKMTHDWALKDFNAADEEDRAGLADQGTARTFYAGRRFTHDRKRGKVNTSDRSSTNHDLDLSRKMMCMICMVCMIQLMLSGGTRTICMIYLAHVFWVGFVAHADPAQPLTSAGVRN